MRRCTMCKNSFPLHTFPLKGNKVDGSPKYSSMCSPCKNEYQRRYYTIPEHRDKQRARVGKNRVNAKKHGLTPQEREDKKKSQNYLCAICKQWSVECLDHDHSCCNKAQGCVKCVRGYLCNSCNWVLGHSKEDIATLQSAIDYLLLYK